MLEQPVSQPRVVVAVPMKSMGVGILLAVVFGPLGLLYSSVLGAVVMLALNVIVGIFTVGFGLIVTWPLCAIWAAIAVSSHNNKLMGVAR